MVEWICLVILLFAESISSKSKHATSSLTAHKEFIWLNFSLKNVS